MKIKLLIAALFLSTAVVAQSTILWTVKLTGNEHVSYLLGTFHQMGNSFIDSLPQIQEALLKSEAAMFESVENKNVIPEMMNTRKDDFSYRDHLKKADVEALELLAKNWTVPLSKVYPLELLAKLQQEYVKANCGTIKQSDNWDHMDNYLIHIAETNHIELKGLESNTDQVNAINSSQEAEFGWEKAKTAISESVSNIKGAKKKKELCKNAYDYIRFNFDYQLTVKCDENNSMLKKRNEKWLPQILTTVENKNSFIAVGLLHLFGECGLIAQLRNRGYTVTPVPLK